MGNDMDLGKAVRRERILFAVTQRELAKATRMALNTVIDIENGRGCSDRALLRICKALGITRERLEGRSVLQVMAERRTTERILRDAYGEQGQYEDQQASTGL